MLGAEWNATNCAFMWVQMHSPAWVFLEESEIAPISPPIPGKGVRCDATPDVS